MPTPIKPIPTNNIRTFRQSKNWTLQNLADAASTSKSQIDKLEKGERRLTVEWMVRLAKPLGCDPRDLLGGPFALRQDKNAAPQQTDTLPIMGTSRTGKDQDIQLTDSPIDQTPRPYFLMHTQDAYAFYMVAENMQPMFRPRQLLFINPHKPPMPNSGVVIIHTDGTLRVMEYLGQKKNGIEVREYAPKQRSILVPFADIGALHAIVAATEPH